jgi:hypothetical protein
VPPGNADVVMLKGFVGAAAATVIDRALLDVCVVLEVSVTFAVKLKVPDEVGVPEITPPELIESPAGKPVCDHV